MKNPLPIYFLFFFVLFPLMSWSQSTFTVRDNDLNGNTTWQTGNTYILDGLVYLESGTLVIQSGVIIRGKQNPTNGDATSALIITREADIIAIGTQQQPIIFTAESDDLSNPVDLNETDRGLWGGLVILGKGQVGTTSTNPRPQGLPNTPRAYYGGTNDTDYSGLIKYVSIRHAGADQIGALTLAGVGLATSVHHIEVFASGADGVSIRGGKVNIKHLAVAYSSFDGIDWQYGWRGKGQFWLILHGDDNTSYNQYAIEAGHALSTNSTLYSNPTIYNATIYTARRYNQEVDNDVAIYFSGASGGTIANSIITGFPNHAIEVEDLTSGVDSRQRMQEGNLKLLNNMWGEFGEGSTFSANSNGMIKVTPNAPDANASFLVNHLNSNDNHAVGNSDMLLNADIEDAFDGGGNFFTDPRYNMLIENYTSASHNDSFFNFNDDYTTGCAGHGAFPNEYEWFRDWTALHTDGYLYDEYYLLYDDKLYQNGSNIDVPCDALESIEKDLNLYSPNCLAPDFLIEVASAARQSRKGRASRNQIIEFDVFVIPFKMTYNLFTYIGNDEHINTRKEMQVNLKVHDICPPIITSITPAGFGEYEVEVEDVDPYPTIQRQVIQLTDCTKYRFRATDQAGNVSEWVEILSCPWDDLLMPYYRDYDEDGYGDPATLQWWGRPLLGYVQNGDDCDDNNPAIHPGMAEEDFNVEDENCDGIIDEPGCDDDYDVITNAEGQMGASYILHAENAMTSDALIYRNSNIIYRSPVSITLEAGFMTDEGVDFKAEIVACPNVIVTDDNPENALLTEDTENIEEQNITNLAPKCFPNPFTNETTIRFHLENRTTVQLDIYDNNDRKIATLIDGKNLEEGSHELTFLADNLMSGIYYVVLRTSEYHNIQKLVLIK